LCGNRGEYQPSESLKKSKINDGWLKNTQNLLLSLSRMLSVTNHQMKKLTRQAAICAVLVIMVVLTFASKGGGGDKKYNGSFRSNFTPIRTLNSFTLKTSSSYNSGSYYMSPGSNNNKLSLNTMITYEKGNTTYILPYKYKVNMSSWNNDGKKSNLQFLGVKIKMPK
jgi:hypothetical protein